jgi:DNA-binding GntR family transcriptional regulator
MATSSLRQQAYDYIHRLILAGDLPGGSQVSEQSLAQQIGISRTPVREAIRQLALEGLVKQVPRYGTIVHMPDRREMAELYDVREALEGFAAAKAARGTAPEDLRLLERLVREMGDVAEELRCTAKETLDESMLRRFLAADMGFHLVLIRAAGNHRIMKIIAEMHVLGRIFGFRRQVHNLKIVKRAHRFHGQILSVVVNQKPKDARMWMARHIRASKRQALESLDLQQVAGDPVPLVLPADVRQELNRIEQNLGLEFAD